MAGRFLFQKLSSRSLLGAHVHAPAFVGAGASATRIAPAARYFSTFLRSRAAAKTSRSATEVPSAIMDRMKPGLAASVGGMKRNFSFSAFNMNEHPWKARLAAWRASWEPWVKYADDIYLPNVLFTFAFLGIFIVGSKYRRRHGCSGCCCRCGGSKSKCATEIGADGSKSCELGLVCEEKAF